MRHAILFPPSPNPPIGTTTWNAPMDVLVALSASPRTQTFLTAVQTTATASSASASPSVTYHLPTVSKFRLPATATEGGWRSRMVVQPSPRVNEEHDEGLRRWPKIGFPGRVAVWRIADPPAAEAVSSVAVPTPICPLFDSRWSTP